MTGAVTFSRYGGPEVLEWTEIPLPEPGEGQVRVRVRAASINPLDAKLRRGDLAEVFPTEFPAILGLDAAGVVDAVGAGVEDVLVGAEVLGLTAGGGYREHALLRQFALKPAGVSFEQAAALPVVGEAAWRSLGHLALVAGETLLIVGAAGSVGSIATQIAVARGVIVIGAVAEADDDYLGSLGGTPVRYGSGLVQRVRDLGAGGVDAVLDTAGRGTLPAAIELAGGPDRVITLADMSAAQYGVRFSGTDPADRAPEAIAELIALIDTGAIKLRITRTYPLRDASTAHRDLEAGRVQGKLVLTT